MSKPLHAAVIGAGQIAKQHLGALAAIDHVQTRSVCDLSAVMAESTAERFGVDHWCTDYYELLDRQPDVVHITTPPASHFQLAKECLLANCHVFVEKPVTVDYEQFVELRSLAATQKRWLIEDHNYLFNHDVQQILSLVSTGTLGEVRHVDVQLCLDLFSPGSRFADPDMPHPAMREPAEMVTDFLTHLGYLAHALVGGHNDVCAYVSRQLPTSDSPITEFQSLVRGERGTALLGISGTSQPDAFTLSVQGTRMKVSTNLFEVGLVATEVLGGSRPLVPIRNALKRGTRERRNAVRSLWRKLDGGPGPYEGLWSLIECVYANLQNGGPPPITIDTIDAVNRLVHEIQQEVAQPCAS